MYSVVLVHRVFFGCCLFCCLKDEDECMRSMHFILFTLTFISSCLLSNLRCSCWCSDHHHYVPTGSSSPTSLFMTAGLLCLQHRLLISLSHQKGCSFISQLHSILPSPLSCQFIVLLSVSLVDSCDLRDERIIRIRITQKRTD